jgi:O-antigen ligase
MVSNMSRRAHQDTALAAVLALAFAGMPLGTSLPIIFGLLAVFIWLISGDAPHTVKAFFQKPWGYPVLPLILLPWIGLLYTPDPTGLGLEYASKTYYWIFGLVAAAVAAKKNPQYLLYAFLAGLFVNALIGFAQVLEWLPSRGGFNSGLGRGYSTLSAYLVLGFLAAAYRFNKAGATADKTLWVTLMGVYFLHLVIMQGRTGYITFVLLSPMAFVYLFPRRKPLYVAGVCLLISGAMWLSPTVQMRVHQSIDQLRYHMTGDAEKTWGREYTVHQDRFYMWRGAAALFLENPLWGVGTGGYQTLLHARNNPADPLIAHPHNDLLYMAVSYGLVGIAAFFGIFVQMIRYAWRNRATTIGHFVLSGTLVILVSGLFNAQILDAGMAFLLAVLAGLQQTYAHSGHCTEKGDTVA